MVEYVNKSKNVAIKEAYSDLDLLFKAHPISGDVTVKTDADAVKRAVKNIVLTNYYERPFKPSLGGNIRGMLFELDTDRKLNRAKERLAKTIEDFEPRARLVSVRSLPDLDRNAYEVIVEFYVVNAPTELVDISLMLERLR